MPVLTLLGEGDEGDQTDKQMSRFLLIAGEVTGDSCAAEGYAANSMVTFTQNGEDAGDQGSR